MKKMMSFEKRSKDWEVTKFYKIYLKDNIKTIKFIGMTDRKDTNKEYLSWIGVYCKEDCEVPVEEFLLWDVYYQFNLLMEKCKNNVEIELEPYECYEQANIWVKGDGNGSIFLRLVDITEDTPCGYYYGY